MLSTKTWVLLERIGCMDFINNNKKQSSQLKGIRNNRIAAFKEGEVGLFYSNLKAAFKQYPFSPLQNTQPGYKMGITTV